MAWRLCLIPREFLASAVLANSPVDSPMSEYLHSLLSLTEGDMFGWCRISTGRACTSPGSN
jgi:hypothetical protein